MPQTQQPHIVLCPFQIETFPALGPRREKSKSREEIKLLMEAVAMALCCPWSCQLPLDFPISPANEGVHEAKDLLSTVREKIDSAF